MPIDPTFAVRGPEWSVGQVGGETSQAPAAGGGGFGEMLTNQLDSLEKLQNDAAQASQGLAAGTATDASAVVMAVERARLSMQLASQIRTKTVDALQDIFHTQI